VKAEWVETTPAYARGRADAFRTFELLLRTERLRLERVDAAELWMPPPGAMKPAPRWRWQVAFHHDSEAVVLDCADEAGDAKAKALPAMRRRLQLRLEALELHE
jgi:hypothetical protein